MKTRGVGEIQYWNIDAAVTSSTIEVQEHLILLPALYPLPPSWTVT